MTFNSQSRTVTFNSQSRTMTFNSQSRTMIFNSQSRTMTYNSQSRTMTFNSQSRTMTYNSQSRTMTFEKKYLISPTIVHLVTVLFIREVMCVIGVPLCLDNVIKGYNNNKLYDFSISIQY